MVSRIVRVLDSFNLDTFVQSGWEVVDIWNPIFSFKKIDLQYLSLRKFNKEKTAVDFLQERILELQEDDKHALDIAGFWTLWSQADSNIPGFWKKFGLILFPSVLKNPKDQYFRIGIRSTGVGWQQTLIRTTKLEEAWIPFYEPS